MRILENQRRSLPVRVGWCRHGLRWLGCPRGQVAWVAGLCLFGFQLLAIQSVAWSQQNDGLPLPAHAEWRFGRIGDDGANGFYRLAYSPDGKYLASRNRANVIEVRDCKSRQLICELTKHKSRVKWMEFANDSEHLMTASTPDEPVMIWNIHAGQVVNVIECDALFATFSQTGNKVFVLEADRVLEYSFPDCRFLKHRDILGKPEIRPVVSRNGQYVIATQKVNNKRLHLTKLIDLENDSSVVLPGPPKPPKAVAISRDEVWAAATYAFEKRVRLWSLSNPSKSSFTLEGHAQTVASIEFSDDGRFLVTTGNDKRVVVWDLATREPVGKLEGHAEKVNTATFAPDRFELASGASGLNDCTVIVWSLEKLLFPDAPQQVLPGQFATAWRGLGSSNPKIALRHVNNLQFSANEVFAHLQAEVGEPMATSQEQIRKWIVQLDASTFQERESALESLMSVRGQAERFLQEAFDEAPSTEVQYRISRILKHSAKRPRINVAELRRMFRAVLLLELISRQAVHEEVCVQLLTALSQNHPHVDVNQDAASALARIQKRIAIN